MFLPLEHLLTLSVHISTSLVNKKIPLSIIFAFSIIENGEFKMFLILLSCFGYTIKIRIFSIVIQRFNLEKKILDLIHFFLLILDVIVIFSAQSPEFIFLMNVLMMFLIVIAPFLLEQRLEREIGRSRVAILDQIILSVQAGIPLRGAIKCIVDQESGWKKIELSKAYSAMILATENHRIRSKILQKMFEEFRFIDQNRVKTLEQLKSLRWQYEILENFRRKSGQVSQQTRLQAVIMTILYIGLFIFSASHFDLNRHFYLVMMSVSFFVTGLITIFVMGRKIRWRI